MGLAIIILPVFLALSFWLTGNNRKVMHILNILGTFFLLAAAVFATRQVYTQGVLSYPYLESFFYLDSLGILVLDTVLVISSLACLYSTGYLEEERRHGLLDNSRIKLFYSLTYSFIFTMVLAVTTQNLGVMWVAIEATTLASVFLVGFHNNKHSLEAAWKYVIICSVGIALALLGIVFLFFSAANVLPGQQTSLNWTVLFHNAGLLHGSVLKIAFIFVLVGFGTKAGLVPMHTWLPDAHSEAPSPISAMFSGVLLNSAMYGIIRILALVNKNLGQSVYTGRLLLALGILSVCSAAFFIITQKDFKRLLAYSSIEHMGIIAFALGLFTPAALFAGLFHMLNHSLTKSMLFLAAGNILQKYRTKEIKKINGLFQLMPLTGTAFLLGLFAIAGMPPFSIFASELGIFLAAFQAKRFLLGSIFIVFIALVFTSIAFALIRDLRSVQAGSNHIPPGETNLFGTLIILLMLLAAGVTGLYMPPFLSSLLQAAVNIVMGG